ncbi:exodeoxyribonuclease VII small subunit [candidate division KSB1 bacterium]|nr:exodeoxyribonuclease VII small subunit [candidate division KSB1 bacterium]
MTQKKFEDAMSELESIVEKLEKGDLTLDESLKIFERGMELSKFCYQKLNQAEQQLKKLVKKDEDFQLELM